MTSYQITEWCHRMIRDFVSPGDLCMDATMGNGHDTAFLSSLAGTEGQVLAFDIQEIALSNTRKRLRNENCPDNTTLFLESHTEIGKHALPGSVSCITFNFGYLPGGDHAKATHPETSLAAVKAALPLLKAGGLLSLCIYSGQDTGFEERDVLLQFLQTLDPKSYLVLKTDYFHRPNHPPIPVFVIRQEATSSL